VFRSGRDLSAWIGLVPKQNSTAARRSWAASARRATAICANFVVGALAVIRRAKQLGYTRHPWLVKLKERRSAKVAAVALANKMARIAWAMMAPGEPYRATLPA
jgi:transposase